jgi:hypothetical protein
MMCLLTLKREIQFYKPLTVMKALNGQRQFWYLAVLLVAIEIVPTFLLDRIQPPHMYSILPLIINLLPYVYTFCFILSLRFSRIYESLDTSYYRHHTHSRTCLIHSLNDWKSVPMNP